MASNLSDVPDRDTDTGQYVAEYPAEEFFTAIRELGRDASTSAIADEVGCKYDAAYKKLTRLEDAGKVKSRKIASARLWELEGEHDSA